MFRVRAVAVRILCLTALLACVLLAVDVEKLPKPVGYVSDFARVVDSQSKEELEAFCTRVDHELGVQLALVTIDTLDGRDVRDFALDLSRRWGVGRKADNQGVLLLLAVKDRKSDIETGRGIEPYITDGFAGSTLRAMRLDLRANDYGAALKVAAQSMAGQIAQGKGVAFSGGIIPPPVPTRREPSRSRGGGGIPGPLIVFGIFVLIWLFSRGGRRGGGMRPRGGGGFGGGLVAGMLADELLRGGRGGGWGGGGFGGDSGGGGGFGGFGGGDFGGGGASSDW